MVQGLFVYVRAKVQERYNQPGSLEIKINKIELLNDVKTTAFNSIRLKVSLEEVNENLIGKLDRLINENAGKSNLEFFIEDEVNKQKVKLFSKKNKVEINDNFLLELDKLITINYDLT
jgi:DNA polymerase-3 subunit alpha